MKKKLLGVCPVCESKLNVTELTCQECKSTIRGTFTLSKFDYLSPSLQEFALIFIKNAGNIKAIEKDLDISYPTVKKNLDELIEALGFDSVKVQPTESLSKEEIYTALRNNEITFETAEKMLQELEENE